MTARHNASAPPCVRPCEIAWDDDRAASLLWESPQGLRYNDG